MFVQKLLLYINTYYTKKRLFVLTKKQWKQKGEREGEIIREKGLISRGRHVIVTELAVRKTMQQASDSKQGDQHVYNSNNIVTTYIYNNDNNNKIVTTIKLQHC